MNNINDIFGYIEGGCNFWSFFLVNKNPVENIPVILGESHFHKVHCSLCGFFHIIRIPFHANLRGFQWIHRYEELCRYSGFNISLIVDDSRWFSENKLSSAISWKSPCPCARIELLICEFLEKYPVFCLQHLHGYQSTSVPIYEWLGNRFSQTLPTHWDPIAKYSLIAFLRSLTFKNPTPSKIMGE